MTDGLYHNLEESIQSWSDAGRLKSIYGSKGAHLTVLPHAWTPPFILLTPLAAQTIAANSPFPSNLETFLSKAHSQGKIIVRSSVIGETIWDRGKYDSIVVDLEAANWPQIFRKAIADIQYSVPAELCGVIIQVYIEAKAKGYFGNLQSVSKTRDQWELSVEEGNSFRIARFNSQRDESADEKVKLSVRSGIALERFFGSIGAWVNDRLLLGKYDRVGCEWVRDADTFYLVQIDEEDEDVFGVNPFSRVIQLVHAPLSTGGVLVRAVDAKSELDWDKLKVLTDLFVPEDDYVRPNLFYVTLDSLTDSSDCLTALAKEITEIIGPDGIVVRTSGKSGKEKEFNLPRTDSLTPLKAAEWCLLRKRSIIESGKKSSDYAFVLHRFIDSRACAWARSDPTDPIVEIHSAWGLPDALQYCAHDVWEVHVPTETATDYPDYKGDMQVPEVGGHWRHVRVKNELARALSIGRREAIEIAQRTFAIAQRLGHPCHVMWFVGCRGGGKNQFNLPWYRTEAHDLESNSDRRRWRAIPISSKEDLKRLADYSPRDKIAIDLKPQSAEVMRDMGFITKVANTSRELGAPIIFRGSTLAHAYFELRRKGCNLVLEGGKERARLRRGVSWGKLVRDKIPDRIHSKREVSTTLRSPPEARLSLLIAKMIEEGLEVRDADSQDNRVEELADLYEVFRAMVNLSASKLDEVEVIADRKKKRVGGFDQGFILNRTGIAGRGKFVPSGPDVPVELISKKLPDGSYQLPFTFLGFTPIGRPRTIDFSDFGIKLEITIEADHIALRVIRGPEQLRLL